MNNTLFITIGTILSLLSPIFYIRSILWGKVRPHRTTRLTILIISFLTSTSLFASGDRVAFYLALIGLIQALAISFLTLKYGMGGWSKSDRLCLVLTFVGIIAWKLTRNPAYGLFFAIGADFMGMVPTIIKTYRFPETEIVSFYLLDAVAGLLFLSAVPVWNPVSISYPIYIIVINGLIAFLAWKNSFLVSTRRVDQIQTPSLF